MIGKNSETFSLFPYSTLGGFYLQDILRFFGKSLPPLLFAEGTIAQPVLSGTKSVVSWHNGVFFSLKVPRHLPSWSLRSTRISLIPNPCMDCSSGPILSSNLDFLQQSSRSICRPGFDPFIIPPALVIIQANGK